MRILYLSQLIPYPPDAGPKVRIYHVLQYLVAAGHDVTLVAFLRDSDQPEDIDHLRGMPLELFTVPMHRSRTLDAWHMGRSIIHRQPWLIARDSVPAMHRLVQQLVSEQSFDFVHADQLWMAQYGLAAGNALKDKRKTRLVLDQHNAVHLIPRRLAESERSRASSVVLRREASLMYQYEIETCAAFDYVVWVTSEDLQTFKADNLGVSTRNSIIPICIDPGEKPVVERKRSAHRVTFLGGLNWPPNAAGITWFAEEVWPEVVRHIPEATLTIIGKQPPAALQNVAAASQSIELTGFVPELSTYLQDTAVFIVPLHAGGGMRVKILDAWSWALPIVSTTIGAEGLKYQDGENLLIGDDIESFAESVIKLINQPELANRIGADGRQTVEKYYDWHKTYNAWDQIYHED